MKKIIVIVFLMCLFDSLLHIAELLGFYDKIFWWFAFNDMLIYNIFWSIYWSIATIGLFAFLLHEIMKRKLEEEHE